MATPHAATQVLPDIRFAAVPASPVPSPNPQPAPPQSPPPPSSSPSSGVPGVPSPSPAPSPREGGTGGGGGLFPDFGEMLHGAVLGLLRDMVAKAINPALELMGTTLLSTPDISGLGRARDLWTVSAGVANAVFVLLVIAGGVLVMNHETIQTRYAFADVAPRLVIASVAANVSWLVTDRAIGLANAASAAVMAKDADPQRAAVILKELLLGSPLANMVALALTVTAVVLALVLVATVVVRSALTVLLVIAAPLFLACHALPQTEGAAYLWWRALGGLLVIQLGQAVTLIAAVRVFLVSDGHMALAVTASGQLIDLLVVCCLLWVLIRIPFWVLRQVTRAKTPTLMRYVKYALVHKGLKAARGRI